MLKRNLMLILKFLIGFIPVALRKELRKNAKLMNFYTLALQRSGLFYGFPSPKQLQKQYDSNIQYQEQVIARNEVIKSSALSQLFIFINEYSVLRLKETVDSALRQSIAFESIIVLCCKKEKEGVSKLISSYDKGITVTTELNEDQFMSLTNLFLIFQGDTLHQECHQMLRHYSTLKSQVIYTDIDYIDASGKRTAAEFYPDWNKELLISTLYIRTGVHIRSVSRALFDKLQKIRIGEDLSLLCLWLNMADEQHSIQHIPLVLVHCDSKKQAISDTVPKKLKSLLKCEKLDIKLDKKTDVLSVLWPSQQNPLVSLIIPTKNRKELVKSCIDSIIAKSEYQNFEIILVDNNSDDPLSLEYFAQLSRHEKIRVISYPKHFNYSAINNFAAKHARGDILGLINNDIVVIEPTWLSLMVGHVLREEVGCVGAKLLYSDGRIQHAGVVLGYGGGAGHSHKYFPQLHNGYLKRLIATQNYSAVTAACLLVKKSDFDHVGGLDEVNLAVAFNDVDFCLKIAELGKSNIYCAEAVLYHLESVSRGLEDTADKIKRFESEIDFLKKKWHKSINHDPAYNYNLTLKRENFAIASKSEYEERDERSV
jgi:GT2 family glycosyltransferase